MRICFVGWADNIHLERWAAYFARQGEEVSVISFSGLGQFPDGVRQYRLGLQKRGIRWKILKLKYLLWKLRPDLVHVHWAHFAQPVSEAWSGPLAITAWGSDIYQLNDPSVVGELVQGLRAGHTITCDSEDLVKRVKQLRGTHGDNVHCVQWGVDVKNFYPDAPDCNLMSELGVLGRRVIFSPRGFLPVYNQDGVLSAFVQVLREMPDAVLIMKDFDGMPHWRRAIRKRIEDLHLTDSVRIVGSVPYERMREFYRMAPVTISVPFSDATPMSVLEAMACGSVPIVSDLPSLREWIVDDWNGYLVSPSDTQRMANRIIHILKNPETVCEFARRNRKIVEDRANQAVHMERMRDLYRAMLDNTILRSTGRIASYLAWLSLCLNLVNFDCANLSARIVLAFNS
ncbi:MAG TPA: glycosyltransferase family 4 protein [Candidatus Binatia bacterium]|jgi:glycosyltransferase involved in cell wall biosynthesis